jgi:hypothetical protein
VAYNNPAQPANPSALPNGPPSSQEGVTPDNDDQGLRGIAKSGQQLFGRMSEQVNSFADTVGERLNLREKESAASIAATGFQNDGYGHNDSHVPSLQPQPQPQPNAEPATFIRTPHRLAPHLHQLHPEERLRRLGMLHNNNNNNRSSSSMRQSTLPIIRLMGTPCNHRSLSHNYNLSRISRCRNSNSNRRRSNSHRPLSSSSSSSSSSSNDSRPS